MSFEKQIQQWVAIDNQMKILNDNIKELYLIFTDQNLII